MMLTLVRQGVENGGKGIRWTSALVGMWALQSPIVVAITVFLVIVFSSPLCTGRLCAIRVQDLSCSSASKRVLQSDAFWWFDIGR